MPKSLQTPMMTTPPDEPELTMQASTMARTVNFPTLIFALGLFLLALLLNISSSGVVRDGGDDEGSGIGGTGRIAIPGSESGLGGTGLKPFVGMQMDTNTEAGLAEGLVEINVLYDPSQRDLAVTSQLDLDIPPSREITSEPLPSPARVAVANQFTKDSSAIDISEQIQRDLDSNALSFMQLREAASQYTEQAVTESSIATRDELDRVPLPDSDFIAETDIAEPATELKDEVSWSALANLLQEQGEHLANSSNPVSDASYITDSDTELDQDRLARPERFQRPELPPVQRVRPIQRAAILPPRVRPLQL